MVRRSVVALMLSLSLLVGVSSFAWAGNSATIELDEHPGQVEAGVKVTIGFTVLQHGVRPVLDGKPALEAIHRESGTIVREDGRPEGDGGHYLVDIVFPEVGEWTWTISAHPFPSVLSFPALTVVAPGQLGEAPALSVAAIIVPRCGVTATPLFELAAFTGPDGTQDSDPSDSDSILRSDSILDVPFADLIDRRAAISVAPAEGGALACGQMLAEPVDGELIVGLSEIDASGYVGFARISAEDDGSIVEIYLAPGLTDAPSAAAPATKVVIEAHTFGPTLVEVAAGSTVSWINHDPVAHEVAFAAIALDDSGPLHQNQEFTQRFDTPGTYEYTCGPHPGMTGIVVVK